MRRLLKMWIRIWNAEPPLGVVLTGVAGACIVAAAVLLLILLPGGNPTLNIVPQPGPAVTATQPAHWHHGTPSTPTRATWHGPRWSRRPRGAMRITEVEQFRTDERTWMRITAGQFELTPVPAATQVLVIRP